MDLDIVPLEVQLAKEAEAKYLIECEKAKRCHSANAQTLTSENCKPVHMTTEEWAKLSPLEKQELWRKQYASTQCAPQRKPEKKDADFSTYLVAGLVLFLLLGKD